LETKNPVDCGSGGVCPQRIVGVSCNQLAHDRVARLQKTVNVWQTEGSPQRVRLRTFPGRGRFASRRGELSAPTLNNDRHFSESF
jgi:hypothetical protein